MIYGITIAVDNPREVGADRIVNAVAAHAACPGNLIVVDFGTATTFDVVTEDADGKGEYRGGASRPASTCRWTRSTATPLSCRGSPSSRRRGTAQRWARNTVHAMQSGVFWGYVGLIEGLVARLTSEIGGPVTVIGTGGLATLFNRHTPAIDRVDGDLTIRGLSRIHAYNSNGA